jgi:hypothetical protein
MKAVFEGNGKPALKDRMSCVENEIKWLKKMYYVTVLAFIKIVFIPDVSLTDLFK